MGNIRFVYFDIGGVLLIDFSGNAKWAEMKRDLGVTPEKEPQFDQMWEKYRPRICLDCDVDTIIDELANAVDINISNDYSMLADFVSRFEKNLPMWDLAQKTKNKYAVGLLTNMAPRMLKAIDQSDLLPKLSWNAVIDSSVVGFQKPDDKIFEIAEETAGVKPNEVFFIDNTPSNIAAAQERGWQTMVYDPRDSKRSVKKIEEQLGL